MSRLAGAAGVLTILLVAMGFAVLNGGHRVTMDLGWVTLYRVPVTFVAFGGLFFGMLVMLLAGLHTDLRVRTILRQRLAEEDREEKGRVDTHQQDLFAPEGSALTDSDDPASGAPRTDPHANGAEELVTLPVVGTIGEPETVEETLSADDAPPPVSLAVATETVSRGPEDEEAPPGLEDETVARGLEDEDAARDVGLHSVIERPEDPV